MRKICNRGFALLLALALCLSALSGIALPASAATVEYRYGSTSQYSSCSNVIYNWGTRGTTATFLSPNAEAFYEENDTSYATLAALSGSSTVSDIPGSPLFTTLRSLMTDNHSYVNSYDASRDMFAFTDCQDSALTSTSISSFYSGDPIGPAWDSGSTWNREHTWPNSKGDANGSGENDIMMLRPASTSENGSRSNKAYGESSSYYDPNEESGSTYDLRGDVARIVLYVYVRWQNTASSVAVLFGTDGVIESRDVLLKWLEEDPVDTWELGRNDSVESITGTRNVFVDYPELGFLLFGEEVPDDYTSPSGGNETESYSITATSNNTAYGTVSLSGTTITATPATGYYASGYTVTGGTATVTQSGNTFFVSAGSDCSVQINFAAKATLTLTYVENGTVVDTVSAYNGDCVTLPSCASELPEDYIFCGWSTAPVEDTETRPDIYTGSYTATEDTTFYAVYRYVSGGTGESNYVKVTDAPADWSGQYVIVYEAGSRIFDGSLTTLDPVNDYQPVTITNGVIASSEADAYSFTIAASGSAYTIQSASGYYIGRTSNNNGLDSNTSTAYTNTISLDSDGNATIIGSGGAYLRYNASSNQNRFRYYKSSSYTGQKAISLYVKTESGTTYYTTLSQLAPVAEADGVSYTSLEAAVAAGGEIKLLQDVTAEGITLTSDLALDVNGYDCQLQVTGAYTVTVKDSAAVCGTDNSNCVNIYSDDAITVEPAAGYLMTEDENGDGYYFDPYSIAITHISLDTFNDALGYKATLAGSPRVQAAVASYGFTMGATHTVTRENSGKIDDGVFSLRLIKIMRYKGGEKDISAIAFVTFADGTRAESSEHTTNMKQTILAVNEMTSLSETQKALVGKYYDAHSAVMAAWLAEAEANNIDAWYTAE